MAPVDYQKEDEETEKKASQMWNREEERKTVFVNAVGDHAVEEKDETLQKTIEEENEEENKEEKEEDEEESDEDEE
jgi:hypothetical protein